MSNKHTPGPWVLSAAHGPREPWFHVFARRTLFLTVQADPDGYVIGENAANARLIAAAPDLLEALEGLLLDYEREIEPGESLLIDRARAAIAKATGEQA